MYSQYLFYILLLLPAFAHPCHMVVNEILVGDNIIQLINYSYDTHELHSEAAANSIPFFLSLLYLLIIALVLPIDSVSFIIVVVTGIVMLSNSVLLCTIFAIGTFFLLSH